MADLKAEEEERTKEKRLILEERVPPLDLHGLTQGQISETNQVATMLAFVT